MKTREELAVTIGRLIEYIHEETSILTIVLKGQLLIESEVESLLHNALNDASVLSLERMFFPNKIDLLIALGILTKDEGKTYKLFNKLRRNYAHDMDYILSLSELDEINSSFTSRLKTLSGIFVKDHESEETEKILKKIIVILLILILWQNSYDPELNSTPRDFITSEEIMAYYKALEIN
jgi:hypothetical protein